jgi:hypothetical protein
MLARVLQNVIGCFLPSEFASTVVVIDRVINMVVHFYFPLDRGLEVQYHYFPSIYHSSEHSGACTVCKMVGRSECTLWWLYICIPVVRGYKAMCAGQPPLMQ